MVESPDAPAALLVALSRAGTESASLRAFRAGVIELLRPLVPFDAALFHALSPRVPLSTAVLVGLDVDALARSMGAWDELVVALGPLRELANQRLAVTDAEAFPRASRARAIFDAQVARPLGQRAVCMVHLVVRAQVIAALVLFAQRAHTFRAPHVALLRAVAPTIALGDALQQRLDGAAAASVPTRLICRDQRLTPRQREIVEHVALGHTNADIALALGVSMHTLRNHLVRVFARLGASNRADVVRLAVLTTPTPRARRAAR